MCPALEALSDPAQQRPLQVGELDDGTSGEVASIQPVAIRVADAFGKHHTLAAQANEHLPDTCFRVSVQHPVHLPRREGDLVLGNDSEDVPVERWCDRGQRMVQFHRTSVPALFSCSLAGAVEYSAL